jgi:hypothetical protein
MTQSQPPPDLEKLAAVRAHKRKLRRLALWLLAINLSLLALRVGVEHYALYWGS